jgi:glycosyltransferase involved in cell wall biosynthesis
VLSIVIPTHNRLKALEACLAALEAQTYQDFEVVVAVDGSTDGSVTMLESVKRRAAFPMVVLVLPHGGRSKARNAALRAAMRDVLVFCDDDVTLHPETLSRHAAFHQMFRDSLAVGPVRYEDGSLEFPRVPSWVNLTGMNSSVPRAQALAVGGFDESLQGWGGEDLEFGYRLQQGGVRFRRLENADATHHAPRVRDAKKAFSAGYQAVMIAKKHGMGVATQLGVHPNLLAIKGLYLNPVGDVLLRRAADYAFERAYLDGARVAWKELGTPSR